MLCNSSHDGSKSLLTEVAGEVGPDLAPQKMKLPSKLRAALYGMKKYVNKICLPSLVPEYGKKSEPTTKFFEK